MKNSYDWWMAIESYEAKALSVIGVLWLRLISSYILHVAVLVVAVVMAVHLCQPLLFHIYFLLGSKCLVRQHRLLRGFEP